MRHLDEQELWALAAGEVSPSEHDAQHLADCRPCQQRVAELVRTRALASSARLPTPSVSARVQGLERFERAMLQESARERRWLERRPLIMPALGLSALAGAGVALLLSGNTPQPVPQWPVSRPASVATVAAPKPAPVVAAAPARQPEVAVAAAPTVEKSVRATPARRSRPAARPVVAPAPIPPPPSATIVEVEEIPRFPRVAAARELLRDGEPVRAVETAIALLASENAEERAAALDMVREVALSQPIPAVLQRIDGVVERTTENRAALMFLACEASVLARRPSEAVQRCRSFVAQFPQSHHARDASYVAGTLARDELNDCAGAVEDYSKAMVFAGPLGSLNDDALFWRASCLVELGRKDEARTDLGQYLARYPSRRVDARVRALSDQLR